MKNKEEKSRKGIHAGHRARINEKYYKFGIDCFSDHEKIELILFYAIPRKDTNCIAHELIKKFGSLSGVMQAKINDLAKVDGMGLYSATLLKLIYDFTRVYLEDSINFKNHIMSDQDIIESFIAKMTSRDRETLALMLLDNKRRDIFFEVICEGDGSSVNIPTQKIVNLATSHEAKYAVIGHNHPSGNPTPSEIDLTNTFSLNLALHIVGVRLIDHIIIANEKFCSLADSSYTKKLFPDDPFAYISDLTKNIINSCDED